jgi:hypothetical protein
MRYMVYIVSVFDFNFPSGKYLSQRAIVVYSRKKVTKQKPIEAILVIFYY